MSVVTAHIYVFLISVVNTAGKMITCSSPEKSCQNYPRAISNAFNF